MGKKRSVITAPGVSDPAGLRDLLAANVSNRAAASLHASKPQRQKEGPPPASAVSHAQALGQAPYELHLIHLCENL